MADLFGEWDLANAQGLEGDLGEGVNLAGLPRKAPKNKNIFAQEQLAEAERARQAARRQQPGGFATNPMYDSHAGFINQFGPQAQANALQGAINQTMNAWQDENDSRVSQEREARRMEHEKEMERMRLDALMQRLAQQQVAQAPGRQPRSSGRGWAIYGA